MDTRSTLLRLLTLSAVLVSFLPQTALADGLFTPGNIQVSLEAGQSTSGTISVTNPLSSPETLSVEISELTTDAQGNLGVRKPTSSTFWGTSAITVSPAQQTATGNATSSIDYTITIPADAEAADQLAAIVIASKHANLPTIYLAIPVWVAINTPGTPSRSFSDNTASSLPAGSITTVETVTNSVAELSGESTEATTTEGSTDAASSSIPATLESTESDSELTTADTVTGSYVIEKFHTNRLWLSNPKQFLTFRNNGRRVTDASATVTYHSLDDDFLGETNVQESTILPGALRTHTIQAPVLYIQTKFGRFPFVGAIVAQATSSQDVKDVTTYIVPWWLLTLLVAAVVGLGSKIAAYHPRAPHKHATFRYQGRLSFASLIGILAFIQYFSQSGWVQIVSADGSAIRQIVHVEATTSYTISASSTETVLAFQLNQPVKIIAGGKVYTVNFGDRALSLPPKTDIIVITPFSDQS